MTKVAANGSGLEYCEYISAMIMTMQTPSC